MAEDDRIERAARALAHHRLVRNQAAGQTDTELGRTIIDRAVEQLWPQLRDEAQAVVEALEEQPSADA
jgi:hypothetical protein